MGAQDVEPRGTIELAALAGVSIPDGAQDRDFCFVLQLGLRAGDRAKDIVLSASSQQELAEWVGTLNNLVAQVMAARISPGSPSASASTGSPL